MTDLDDQEAWVRPLRQLRNTDAGDVGGKNASLGELLVSLAHAGVNVPDGFATTSAAYWQFIEHNDLRERLQEQLARLGDGPLREVGAGIRELFSDASFPQPVADAITDAYRDLAAQAGAGEDFSVAVRSSATAEDLPQASFAGQQETFLNVSGEDALLDACRRCYASLFTDRAISYRRQQGFDHLAIALSVGVQRMVRADLAGAGVMFSLDTDTGFRDAVLIDAAFGLGEAVVSGTVDPDEHLVFKPLLERDDLVPILATTRGSKACKVVYDEAGGTTTVDTTPEEQTALVLDDAEVLRLARWAVAIEQHYDRPMDMEWAKDGATGELFVVQARPETVHSQRQTGALHTYQMKEAGRLLASGVSVGQAIAAGTARLLRSPGEGDRFEDGAVLVTAMTDPDWEPLMERAAAVVTDHGGRTSHAAIVSRELGLPAVIGTGDATSVLEDGAEITVSCAEGDEGHVYDGIAEFDVTDIDLDAIPRTSTQVMLNLANPHAALRWWRLPADGVGLARLEFVINNAIQAHPLALARFDELDDPNARDAIEQLTAGYDDKRSFFVDTLAHGIARIAASQWPDPVIVRLSDFKTNEYADLIGGAQFEPAEENPMLGWRGASRYDSQDYREGFALECAALRKVRGEIGLTNVIVMIPFCRTLDEADRVLGVLGEHGLIRGQDGLEVYVMAEIPANIILAEEFAARFDGFSIGSNDLTQLVLGVDRDSDRLAPLFDERNPAVMRSIEQLITTAKATGRKVGLCGQAPSDDPSFAEFLVEAGIDSISIAPDTFLDVKRHVAAAERIRADTPPHDPSRPR